MKALFVSTKEGQRVVHWKKLSVFAVFVLVLAAAVGESLWWFVAHTLSVGALIVAVLVGVIVVVRVVVHAITYQGQELELTAGGN
jgi:hypothetical protein